MPTKRTYQQTLAAAHKAGAVHANDLELIALLCAGPLQTLVGAVSPELVFDGAQKKDLTSTEFAALVNRDPDAVEALQWI